MGHKQAAGVGAGIEKLHVPQIKSRLSGRVPSISTKAGGGCAKAGCDRQSVTRVIPQSAGDSAHKCQTMVGFLQPITTTPPTVLTGWMWWIGDRLDKML